MLENPKTIRELLQSVYEHFWYHKGFMYTNNVFINIGKGNCPKFLFFLSLNH